MDSELKGKSISKCFDEALTSFEEISDCDLPTNSSEIQYKVKKCMNLLEDITRMVSMAGMFSRNESISEIATSDIKFVMLPSLLGNLALKLTNGDRREIVLTAEVYFKDFLRRCKDYGLTDIDVNVSEENAAAGQTAAPSCSAVSNTCPIDLMSLARRRAVKIQRYHEQKELESQLKVLKDKFHSGNVDDDTKREYYLTLIRSYIDKAVEDLDCIQSEKTILCNVNKMKEDGSWAEEMEKHTKRIKSKPLLPVIITRDEVQKKVFGAGYPSIPTMTVEELYQQRIAEGTWKAPASDNAHCLQDMAANEELKAKQLEEDVVEKERALEREDPDALARDRAMDEYKDDHRRGWGNRYNRS